MVLYVALASHTMSCPDKILTTTSLQSTGRVQLSHPIAYYHEPSHPLPYNCMPAGCYPGHQHPQCPIHTHQAKPKVKQLETELTAGDTTSAYLALAQTIPSAAEPIQDTSYALFHPLLAISILVAAITDTPSSKVAKSVSISQKKGGAGFAGW
ncbi:hypothetical protein LQV05_006088 [Cryptococcus neoformans]|nr:hypothetical protein LQV05_006088 [Cryptococcus neoformans]